MTPPAAAGRVEGSARAEVGWLRRAGGPWLAWAFRLALGVVFIVAAVPKIAAPDEFAWSIAHYDMVPDGWINAMAIMLPWKVR